LVLFLFFFFFRGKHMFIIISHFVLLECCWQGDAIKFGRYCVIYCKKDENTEKIKWSQWSSEVISSK
jgi:hypothetical protein